MSCQNLTTLTIIETSRIRHPPKKKFKSVLPLNGDDVVGLLNCLCKVAERYVADVDWFVNTYFREKDHLVSLPVDKLLGVTKQDRITVLDLRPAEEYAASHLPGAINLNVNELEFHLEQFSTSTEIVDYCRGPHCVLAFDAVDKLRQLEFKARRLEKGFPQWKSSSNKRHSVNSKN